MLSRPLFGQLRPLNNYKLNAAKQHQKPQHRQPAAVEQGTTINLEKRSVLIRRRNKNVGPRRRPASAPALSDRAYYLKHHQHRNGAAGSR